MSSKNDVNDVNDEAIAHILSAVDEFGQDCANRMNSPSKYGEYRQGQESWARGAVRAAIKWELEQAVKHNERA